MGVVAVTVFVQWESRILLGQKDNVHGHFACDGDHPRLLDKERQVERRMPSAKRGDPKCLFLGASIRLVGRGGPVPGNFADSVHRSAVSKLADHRIWTWTSRQREIWVSSSSLYNPRAQRCVFQSRTRDPYGGRRTIFIQLLFYSTSLFRRVCYHERRGTTQRANRRGVQLKCCLENSTIQGRRDNLSHGKIWIR